MRLVVLDTNIIVSAGIKPGCAPAKLVMDWVLEGQIQVVTSPWIVSEYREVVRRTKFHRYGFPPHWLEFLIEESLHLPDPATWVKRGPDPKDMPFLALAHVAGAWLVTGNLKHFPETVRNGVTVLSPTEYLTHLGKD
ncbi:MAG TPA: putative toxin-antitoxin system toxin component, PIN family [Acidobacteriaceae bacterium]|nr:putative toxin-antitoxin system toxin component, PIN family [Acidobacteriaceae bacterium]